MRALLLLATSVSLLSLSTLLWPTLAVADDDRATPKPSLFLRFVQEDNGDAVLESAVVTYRREDGVQVDLVGALHIGEKKYYAGLDKLFTTYDALLYEMVKDRNASIEDLQRDRRRNGKRGALGAVSMLQRWMKDTLDLEFQLDAVDYTRANFVHADLDIQTFIELQKKRGESLLTLLLRAIKHDLARQSRGEKVATITLLDFVRVFLAKDQAREWRLVLARQFENIEDTLAGIEGPDGSVLLTERNKVAMKVLGDTIDRGKKKIGIFYGAGHMQDLEARLLATGFRKVLQNWRLAWDMRQSRAKPDGKRSTKEKPSGEKRVKRARL